MIRRRAHAALVAALLATGVLLISTLSGDSRRVTGRLQSSAQSRVACVTAQVIVDITTELGYPPWGHARGTGVMIDSRDVLTNNHVVFGAARIMLHVPSGGAEYAGDVVATDVRDDLALIRVRGGGAFTAAQLGDSSAVAVGQPAFAVGNGDGNCGTPRVTQGTVAALNQSTSVSDDLNGDPLRLSGLIKVRIDVESGYSGGALVNEAGKVIGILTAGHAAASCHCFRAAYAIPIDKAASIAGQMAAGIASTSVHVGAAASLGLAVASGADVPSDADVTGALITYVAPGSPADRLGLGRGNQVLALDGSRVRSALDLITQLQAHRPGDTVQLCWTDDAWQTRTSRAVLARGPAQ